MVSIFEYPSRALWRSASSDKRSENRCSNGSKIKLSTIRQVLSKGEPWFALLDVDHDSLESRVVQSFGVPSLML